MDSREKAIQILADLSGIQSQKQRDMLEEAVLNTLSIEELQGLKGIVVEEHRLALLAAHARKQSRAKARINNLAYSLLFICLLASSGLAFYFWNENRAQQQGTISQKAANDSLSSQIDSLKLAYEQVLMQAQKEKKQISWAKAKAEAAKKNQELDLQATQAHNWAFTAENLLQQRMRDKALRLADHAYQAAGRRPSTAISQILVKSYFYNEEVHYEHLLRHNAAIRNLAAAPNGKVFVSVSNDKTAKIWSVSGQLVGTLKGHQKPVLFADFSPNSKQLVTASEDETAILWSTSSGQMLTKLAGHRDDVRMARFSPDGKLIATASYDQTAIVWNLDGSIKHELKGHKDAVDLVAFSTDGKYLATASWDNSCRIWDLKTGQLLSILEGHQDRINHIAFSPSGKTIISSSEDALSILWDLEGNQVQTFALHSRGVKYAAFAPNGKRIATASSDGTGMIWNLDGTPVQRLSGHSFKVLHISYSKNGEYILTAATDNTLRLWDKEGEFIQEYKGHQEELTSAGFIPGNKYMMSASYDKSARIWLMPEGIHRWIQNNPQEVAELSEDEKKEYGIEDEGKGK